MGDLPLRKIIIASDSDLTATKTFMQVPLLEHFGYDMADWIDTFPEIDKARKAEILDESAVPEELRVSPDMQRAGYCEELTWLYQFMEFVNNHGPDGERWAGVTKAFLREMGAEVELFPGLPDAIPELKESVSSNREWAEHGITLEYHLISAGLFDIIAGNRLAKYCDGLFATELAYHPVTREVMDLAFPINSTTKTRFLYSIMKGPGVGVNEDVAPESRIPGENFIVLADGQSDKPLWAEIRNHYGGLGLALYDPEARSFNTQENAQQLFDAGRVDHIAEADYRPGSELRTILEEDAIPAVAEKIMRQE